MTLEDIAALRVPAADDAHLYLWTTSGFLPAAFEVVKAWGFRYSTTLVWAKAPIGNGLGGDYGIATEFVLFARRGHPERSRKVGRNWFQWKRPYDERGKPRHSSKPEEFYAMVEQVSPGPFLEMFARRARLGWDVWGDEAPHGWSATHEPAVDDFGRQYLAALSQQSDEAHPMNAREQLYGDATSAPGAPFADPCPKAHLHTPAPESYIGWHIWAETKSRRHYQVRCPGCGLLHIWRRKPLSPSSP